MIKAPSVVRPVGLSSFVKSVKMLGIVESVTYTCFMNTTNNTTKQCPRCAQHKLLKEFSNRRGLVGGASYCKECASESMRGYKHKPKTKDRQMLAAAKQRAKRFSLPFNIDLSDVVVPSHCPLLGLELLTATGPRKDNSPSLDRIVPELGYVKGNVRVVSDKANRIKSNATFSEFEKMYLAWKAQETKKPHQS